MNKITFVLNTKTVEGDLITTPFFKNVNNLSIKPYDEVGSKKKQVAKMFDNIAHRYDFLNHFLSLGIDIQWRKKLIKEVVKEKPLKGLDVASGTGDLAIMLCKHIVGLNMIGSDISTKMLDVGKNKAQRHKLEDRLHFEYGDAENLDYDDNSFDMVCVSFGVRNFENLELGLSEIHRVLQPGKALFILEFSKPQLFPLKQLYDFYFKNILPMIGRIQSKDSKAYTYLYDSVQAFPYGKDFEAIMKNIGFKVEKCRPLTFGICHLYIGRKL